MNTFLTLIIVLVVVALYDRLVVKKRQPSGPSDEVTSLLEAIFYQESGRDDHIDEDVLKGESKIKELRKKARVFIDRIQDLDKGIGDLNSAVFYQEDGKDEHIEATHVKGDVVTDKIRQQFRELSAEVVSIRKKVGN